jgi:hypothetical protein
MKKTRSLRHYFTKKWLNLVLIAIAFSGILQGDCFGFAQSDLNKDGSVNFFDFVIMTSQWLEDTNIIIHDPNALSGSQPVDMLNGTLTRNSIAFLDGKQYVANAPRKKIMAASSASDFELVTSIDVNGVGAIAPIVHCLSGGYLWATTSSKTGLYKSQDGITWVEVQSSSALTGIDFIHPHSSGAIFVVHGEPNGYKLYKSADGSDLTNAHLPAPKVNFDKPNGYCTCQYYNFHEAANGTICIGEYGGNDNRGGCRSIWRSSDGGDTFSKDPVYIEADTRVKHSHRIYKQEASGRWVAVWGDGGNIDKTSYSDDDGLSWADLETNTDYNFQPTEFYEYGHSTRLLYGSDESDNFGVYDVFTKQIEPLYWDGPSLEGGRYCWAITQYDGIFYASIMQTAITSAIPVAERRASIVISNDLVHWDVYHQFNDELGIYRYLGVLNNKIHCIVWPATGALQYGRFTPTAIKTYNALCIDPATTNLLTANASSMETDASSWICTGTKNSFSTDSLHGSKCVQFNSSVYADTLRFANGINTDAGQLYSGHVAMKGFQTNQGGYMNWTLYGSNRTDTKQYWGLGREQWQDLPLNPLTILQGDTSLDIYIRGYGAGLLNIPNPTNLLLDCVQVERGAPTRWQVGGTARAHEVLAKTYAFGDNWTEYIIWAPATRLDYFLPGWGNQYIKCWYNDANNYLELYYDPSDFKFKLQATIDGVLQDAVSTANTYKCYTNASVRLVIRGGQQFWLSVNYAGGWEHLEGISAFTGIVGTKTGNYADTNVISGSYLSDLLYDYVMSDKRVEMEAEYSGTALYDMLDE